MLEEKNPTTKEFCALQEEVIACRRCPRLVAWREEVSRKKVARFSQEEYWGKPVPGFGDLRAKVLIVGLAPAAHGGNRTGRVFTGDRSGDFLYASLHRTGFANQAKSVGKGDGLALRDAYITAVGRCCPPANALTPQERDACLPFLRREVVLLSEIKVFIALGAVAWDGILRTLSALGHPIKPRPRFGHGAEAQVGPYLLLGSFHPSQQNTFTGRLTPPMLDAVFLRAREAAGLKALKAGGA